MKHAISILLITLTTALASGPLGEWKVIQGSFIRPNDATPYASGDLTANSTTAGSVVPVPLVIGNATETQFEVSRIRISKTSTGISGAAFRIHLFSVSPTVTSGDNAAIVIATGAAGYLGQWDVAAMQSFTDGATGFIITGANKLVLLGAGTIYALVECRGAYTPTALETFTVTLEGTVNR